MSFLEKLIPDASRAVRSYYWLYLAGTVLPILLANMYMLKDGTLSLSTPVDWIILFLSMLIPAVNCTLAYVDKRTPDDNQNR